MFIIDDTRTINASASELWQVLINNDAYGEWNPFVVRCQSTFEPGSAIIMHVKIWSTFALRQKETIRANEAEKFLEYGIRLPGLLTSVRQHKLEVIDEHNCRYQSYFELQGLLAPVVKQLLGARLQRGFLMMTDALQRRAQQSAQNADQSAA